MSIELMVAVSGSIVGVVGAVVGVGGFITTLYYSRKNFDLAKENFRLQKEQIDTQYFRKERIPFYSELEIYLPTLNRRIIHVSSDMKCIRELIKLQSKSRSMNLKKITYELDKLMVGMMGILFRSNDKETDKLKEYQTMAEESIKNIQMIIRADRDKLIGD